MDPEKQTAMAPTVLDAGCELRLAEVFVSGRTVLAVKLARAERVLTLTHCMLDSGNPHQPRRVGF